MTGTDCVYINHHLIDTGDCSGPKSARNVLMHTDVDAAVLETARGGMLRKGLGFDRCEVAVVTNIGEGDYLGLNYITSVEDLDILKSVIVQNVPLLAQQFSTRPIQWLRRWVINVLVGLFSLPKTSTI